jgi:hypothetical protein
MLSGEVSGANRLCRRQRDAGGGAYPQAHRILQRAVPEGQPGSCVGVEQAGRLLDQQVLERFPAHRPLRHVDGEPQHGAFAGLGGADEIHAGYGRSYGAAATRRTPAKLNGSPVAAPTTGPSVAGAGTACRMGPPDRIPQTRSAQVKRGRVPRARHFWFRP